MVEAQRALEKIRAMLDSASFARAFAEHERHASLLAANGLAISRYVETMNSMAPHIQRQIDYLNSASNAAALAGLKLSLADTQIQSALRAFEGVLQIVPPGLWSRLRSYAEVSDDFRSMAALLRQTSGVDVTAALRHAVSEATPATLKELQDITDTDALQGIAAGLDDVAAQLLDEEQSSGETPHELTAIQRVWLAVVMIVLIWFLTMGEQDNQVGEELHEISQGVIASAILWAVIRGAGERD